MTSTRPVIARPEVSMQSYTTAYANALHSSRVDIPSFTPRALTPVSGGASGPREFVLASPSGAQLALASSGALALLPPSTPRRPRPLDERGARARMLTADGAFDGESFHPWSGDPIALPYTEQETTLATWTDGARWIVVQSIQGGERRDTIGLIARFSLHAPGMLASGKIDDRARDAFVTEEGRVFVLAADYLASFPPDFSVGEGDAAAPFPELWVPLVPDLKRSLGDARGYAISGVAGGIALLRGSRIVDLGTQGGWSTELELFSAEGESRSRASVDFAVRQPPIDGGDGRVYLAGDGFAAIEHRETSWEVRGGRVRATAFVDGAVALATGPALEIRSPTGDVMTRLETPDGSPFITPPAIARDGSIWVATDRVVYAAR
ncbi:MAG: hypothetical protein U0414_16810 [Polyangiaceae bacterium]